MMENIEKLLITHPRSNVILSKFHVYHLYVTKYDIIKDKFLLLQIPHAYFNYYY
jgi:hypothetical protein